MNVILNNIFLVVLIFSANFIRYNDLRNLAVYIHICLLLKLFNIKSLVTILVQNGIDRIERVQRTLLDLLEDV
jgi:hypothetical protein